MAKDCLCTEYKAGVDSSNLPYLGYEVFRFKMSSATVGALLTFKKNSLIKFLDCKWTATGVREVLATANVDINLNLNTVTPDEPSQAYCTALISKYDCYNYSNVWPASGKDTMNLTGYQYGSADDVTSVSLNFQGASSVGEVKVDGLQYCPWSKLTSFNVNDLRFVGDIDLSLLGIGGNLTQVSLSNIGRYDNTHGDLSNLGKSPMASSINMPYCRNISIDLVTFVENNRTAGRTSGSINMRYLGGIVVKVNGTIITWGIKVDNVLVWTADSITLDGEPLPSA